MDINTRAEGILNELKIKELKHTTETEIKFLRASDILEAVSILFTCMCTILAFTSGYYTYTEISLTAGLLGVIASTMLIYSRYAYKEAQERERRIEKILDSIKKNNFEFLLRNSPSESIV